MTPKFLTLLTLIALPAVTFGSDDYGDNHYNFDESLTLEQKMAASMNQAQALDNVNDNVNNNVNVLDAGELNNKNVIGAHAAGGAAEAAGLGIGVGGNADALGTGGNATNDGNQFSTDYNDNSDYRAYALAVGSANAAPAVSGKCLVHLRGFGIFSAGSSGRTKLDESCVAFERCMGIADRLFAWGQPVMAIEQIRTCDGAAFESELQTVVTPVDDGLDYVTTDHLDRIVEDLAAK